MVESIISATEADWIREKSSKWWEPSHQLLKSIRHYQKWQKQGGIAGYILCRWNVIQHRFWSVVTATDIPLNCQLQGGLLLPHPNGIVIHPSASIGPNCLILQQVTIVADVKIGGHVDIGAGAKIIRSVTIGDHALIGANAVVICDVPPGATAVGIPAKIIEKKTQEV
ncbi:serine acetyltransferase [Microcoleus sp. MON2_D5]|uniref:serine acetyltransferase n=1 Tax=Microcoleus sp. MON2_D5 TaxID=2818833 RepID=UPI002FD6537F